jgi:hypothetical protein
MGTTPVALYRRGNTTSARLDHVRLGIDVASFTRNGVEWVTGRSGGVSTFATDPPPGTGRIWTLDAGTTYPETLYLYNDQGDHWSWDPAIDMLLADYRDALAVVNGNFR